MGNCQAVDAAALVIQHPSGKIERLYWPISVSEVMRLNPGYHVSLIIPLPVSEHDIQDPKTVRFNRVKLLRPSETLALGHAYRLVTTQEVMKALNAKKYGKTKKEKVEMEAFEKKHRHRDIENQSSSYETEEKSNLKMKQTVKHERHRLRKTSANAVAKRSQSWRPSLQSIYEATS